MPRASVLSAHPESPAIDPHRLSEAIDTLAACSQACTICADACLAEPDVRELAHCIRLDLDCAAICRVTAELLSRQTVPDWQVIGAQVRACRAACHACKETCARHAAHHEHCRICAEWCRACEAVCERLLQTLPA